MPPRMLFADTFYWVALLNPRDAFHSRVSSFNSSLGTARRRFLAAAPAVYYSGRSTFSLGVEIMAYTIEAVYENGVLKPAQPLPLREHETVQVTVVTKRNWVEETAGIMGFQGTAEEADYFAMDPDLDFPPPPEER